ncbi:hypothetical protein [Leptolyngbya sp. 'hensonii']|uniref:hypothetical protein n=1 Tax=Leptolyngbya sp. 'hensonii' TaxID=1922337 RepID=UPI00117D9B13|nr:hypothetical protein [Leptolyngbya sp. 'hensonii']
MALKDSMEQPGRPDRSPSQCPPRPMRCWLQKPDRPQHRSHAACNSTPASGAGKWEHDRTLPHSR